MPYIGGVCRISLCQMIYAKQISQTKFTPRKARKSTKSTKFPYNALTLVEFPHRIVNLETNLTKDLAKLGV